MKRCVAGLVAAATLACHVGHAQPYLPASDAQVLERLPLTPAGPVATELKALRARLALQPDSLPVAVHLARRYVEIGRGSGDPRYAGYAEAVLRPWSSLKDPPREVLLLRALLRQRVHDFDAALQDLDSVLRLDALDVQARLTRATIHTVRGEYDRAKADCEVLRARVQELVWAVCDTSVEGMRGRLHHSYALLSEVLARSSSDDDGLRAWGLTALGEMALRLGRLDEAQRHFHAALALDDADQYLLSAHADQLLDSGQPRRAVALVERHLRADGLLLRYALALLALGDSRASARCEELAARFDAASRRGDRAHLREEARFTLHMLHDVDGALALARENWAVQKEAADAHVLVEAAIAAHASADLEAMRRWMQSTGYEDHLLARLLSTPDPPAAKPGPAASRAVADPALGWYANRGVTAAASFPSTALRLPAAQRCRPPEPH
jgi:tetratricopeptide (TPR) repeat protein